MTEALIDALRATGLDDGMILEINQVTAYFAYANRRCSASASLSKAISWASPPATPTMPMTGPTNDDGLGTTVAARCASAG